MLILITICYLAICIKGVKCRIDNDFFGKNQTNSIKGIFILMVFMSHVNMHLMSDANYVPSGMFEKIYFVFPSLFGQLMVVMFLFYSGYGVMESIKTKGNMYIRSFPKHRILTTLINFDIAVLVYILLSPLTNIHLEKEKILLYFIGWESAGNSNWYIFDIILCYLLTWFLGAIFIRNNEKINKVKVLGGALFLFTIVIFVLSNFKQHWWFDTLLSYVFGIGASLYKDSLIPVLKKYYITIFLILMILFSSFYFSKLSQNAYVYNIMATFFSMIVVLISMKFDIGNRYLRWCGNHLFPIYIYMLLPIRILLSISEKSKDFAVSNSLIFVSICFCSTLLIAFIYKRWEIKL